MGRRANYSCAWTDLRRWLRDELPSSGVSANQSRALIPYLAGKADDQDRARADSGEIATPNTPQHYNGVGNQANGWDVFGGLFPYR